MEVGNLLLESQPVRESAEILWKLESFRKNASLSVNQRKCFRSRLPGFSGDIIPYGSGTLSRARLTLPEHLFDRKRFPVNAQCCPAAVPAFPVTFSLVVPGLWFRDFVQSLTYSSGKFVQPETVFCSWKMLSCSARRSGDIVPCVSGTLYRAQLTLPEHSFDRKRFPLVAKCNPAVIGFPVTLSFEVPGLHPEPDLLFRNIRLTGNGFL